MRLHDSWLGPAGCSQSPALWYNARSCSIGVDCVITKRMVGIILAVLGAVTVGVVLAVDLIGAGKWGGIGPAQLLAARVSLVVFLVGLSLIPLGDRPA